MTVILGLDTATGDTSVAACEGESVLAEVQIGPGANGRPQHAAALLAAIERVAASAGGWERIDELAVGVGPGSFTGVRIGVATARGLAQARGLPLRAIHTTDALLVALAAGADPERDLLAVLDARRGELYAALQRSGSPVPGDPGLATPDALPELAQGLTAPIAAGDGAIRFRGELEAIGVEVAADADPVHRISAAGLCIAARRVQPQRAEDVKPLYLRKPDAELWRERDGRN